MSNPLINRWGSNIYWSKLWYSDKNYTTNLKQDSIFNHLLKAYFMYGLQTPKNLFLLKYWYFNKKNLNIKWNHINFQNTYYRRYAKNSALNDNQDFYKLRLQSKDIFPMKMWIFKFQNWILINLYWFQPVKKSFFKKLRQQPKTFTLLEAEQKQTFSSLRRYRLFVSKNFFKICYKKFYYKF
jgi:hypothetical protein